MMPQVVLDLITLPRRLYPQAEEWEVGAMMLSVGHPDIYHLYDE